jgi:hypothetical protein
MFLPLQLTIIKKSMPFKNISLDNFSSSNKIIKCNKDILSMPETKKWQESKTKERVGNNFVKSVFESSGYLVMDFGIEHHNMEIIQTIKGSYKTDTNKRLMCMPDFVVVDPNTLVTELVEVKYRKLQYYNLEKTNFMFPYRNLKDYLEYWKDMTLVLVMNVEPFCLAIRMKNVDWNNHFVGKKETENGKKDEIWNFNTGLRPLWEIFPRVTKETFEQTRKIVLPIGNNI